MTRLKKTSFNGRPKCLFYVTKYYKERFGATIKKYAYYTSTLSGSVEEFSLTRQDIKRLWKIVK